MEVGSLGDTKGGTGQAGDNLGHNQHPSSVVRGAE
jgi:hypothetical protein